MTRVDVTIAPPASGVFQQMEGGGAQVRAFSHPDTWWGAVEANGVTLGRVPPLTSGQEDAIHDALYSPTAGIGLTRARTCDPTCSAASGSDGRRFDIQATDGGAFDFSGPRVDDLATYFAKARLRGPVKCWWSPLFPEGWMGNTTATHVTKRATYALAVLDRYRDQGAELDYYSVANEPTYTRNTMSAAFYRDVAKELAPQLVSAAIGTDLVPPDDIRSTNAAAMIDTLMADGTAALLPVAFATHLYDEALTNFQLMTDRGVTHGKSVWMSEFFPGALGQLDAGLTAAHGYAQLIHELIVTYGCTAVDSMVSAWGQQESTALVSLGYSGAPSTYTGLTITKLGRYMGQWWRDVRPGARRVTGSSSDSNVKVSAFRQDNKRVVVAINTTAGSLTPTLTVPAISGLASMATVYRTSGNTTGSGDNWLSLSAQGVSGETIAPTLPATSVTTFVGTF